MNVGPNWHVWIHKLLSQQITQSISARHIVAWKIMWGNPAALQHTLILASMPDFSPLHCASCFFAFSRSLSRSAHFLLKSSFSCSKFFKMAALCSSFFSKLCLVFCLTKIRIAHYSPRNNYTFNRQSINNI